MWRLTMILNALLMGIFALGSAASQVRVQNIFVEYPEVGGELFGDAHLPAITIWALRTFWLCWAVPLLWGALTVVLIMICTRRVKSAPDFVQLHTSATLLVGLFMLTFFVVAAVLPFITIVVGLN